MKSNNSHQSVLLILMPIIFVLLWAGGYSVAKVGLQYSEPMTLLVWRYLLVIILLIPFYIFLRPPLPDRGVDWMHVVIVGVLVQAVYFGMSWYAFSKGVSAGVLAIIMSLQPILVAILAPKLANERVSWLRWAGLILGLTGVIIVIVARTSIHASTLIGIGFGLLGLCGITSGVLYEKRFGVSYHPVISNLIQFTAGLCVIFPIAYLLETMLVQWTGELMLALAYLVIGNSILAMSLLIVMIRVGEVSRVSALMFLVPPFAAIFGWVLLGEKMPPIAWFGMVIAATGVILATKKKKD